MTTSQLAKHTRQPTPYGETEYTPNVMTRLVYKIFAFLSSRNYQYPRMNFQDASAGVSESPFFPNCLYLLQGFGYAPAVGVSAFG